MRSRLVKTRWWFFAGTALKSPTSSASRRRSSLYCHVGRVGRGKGGYDLFMLKEIAEQPKAVADTLLGRIGPDGQLQLDNMTLSDHELREIDKIVIVACGTAYHSGMIAKYAIGHWTRIPTEVELASEFRYRDPILNSRILVISISQSGETMDTLMAMRYAREQGSKVLAICNTQGSTIPREADAASTPTRVQRLRLHRRRHSSRRWLLAISWRCTWRRYGEQVRRRDQDHRQ